MAHATHTSNHAANHAANRAEDAGWATGGRPSGLWGHRLARGHPDAPNAHPHAVTDAHALSADAGGELHDQRSCDARWQAVWARVYLHPPLESDRYGRR